ncbi:MAG: SDR family oxidoreductase [Gemmatimonadales bacterium]|nr:SDR family oxidoreductase [Gemmatimonadales bacterium]
MAGSNPKQGRLHGRHVFITGASRGIGRAIAIAMAAEGASLTLAATSEAALRETASLCDGSNGRSHRVQVLDVSDREACFAAIASAWSEGGAVDALVNSAGVYRSGAFLDYEDRDFRDMLEVNLHGTIHLMQAVLPRMIERGEGGRIVNIASSAGKWASANQSAYNVSKHAVVGLTRCVALEMGTHGICVNAICPGLVKTDMMSQGFGRTAQMQGRSLDEVLAPILSRVAMKRVLQPEEIAGLAVFLVGPESSGMTGQSLQIDGGMVYV